MNVFVTGGAGYIGSHTVLALLQAGHEVTVFDNLSNSKEESLRRVATLAGRAPAFIKGDIRDRAAVSAALDTAPFDAVIHFAGLKAVGESVRKPWLYYDNNIAGSLVLFDEMARHGVFRLVFSSSATVYGDPKHVPIEEDMERFVAAPYGTPTTNPYGRTKAVLEDILRDLAVAEPRWRVFLLRYFNPVGAHESGLIGEDPNGIPNNLMPYISQVAIGRLAKLRVFGDDYPTPDGTGVRDYIHVVDLAVGHVKALECIDTIRGCDVVNLGTGRGYSVLEMLHAFEKACGHALPYEIAPRREGDIAACYASPEKARTLLGWTATRGIDEMCADAWRWQTRNPNGFADA